MSKVKFTIFFYFSLLHYLPSSASLTKLSTYNPNKQTFIFLVGGPAAGFTYYVKFRDFWLTKKLGQKVVLLDLNFDGDSRTGLDIFSRISAEDSDVDVDVTVISGETDTQKAINIMNAGITHFIPKSASMDQIRIAVQQAVKKKEI